MDDSNALSPGQLEEAQLALQALRRDALMRQSITEGLDQLDLIDRVGIAAFVVTNSGGAVKKTIRGIVIFFLVAGFLVSLVAINERPTPLAITGAFTTGIALGILLGWAMFRRK